VQSKRSVFLDLDGTLLDVSRRHHAVHREIVAEIGGEARDLQTFWQLKQDATPIAELTGLGPADVRRYQERWQLLIEQPCYLGLDTWLPEARQTLGSLTGEYTVVITTLRQHDEALRDELRLLECPPVAQLLSAPAGDDAVRTKTRLIRSCRHYTREAVVAGDTEVDIRAGKVLGLLTVAVANGLRSHQCLVCEAPDCAIARIDELPQALRSLQC
jgi:phosphoglycolate phosphatase-like HAD superfamily hydrolase